MDLLWFVSFQNGPFYGFIKIRMVELRLAIYHYGTLWLKSWSCVMELSTVGKLPLCNFLWFVSSLSKTNRNIIADICRKSFPSSVKKPTLRFSSMLCFLTKSQNKTCKLHHFFWLCAELEFLIKRLATAELLDTKNLYNAMGINSHLAIEARIFCMFCWKKKHQHETKFSWKTKMWWNLVKQRYR